MVQRQVDEGGTDHAAQGRHERVHRFFTGLRSPPGRKLWVISTAAMPKKKTMKMSFVRK